MRRASIAFSFAILVFVTVVMGCGVSISQRPSLASIESADTPVSQGSGVLIIESVRLSIKNRFHTKTPWAIRQDFIDKLAGMLRETGIFSAVYEPKGEPDESEVKLARLSVNVHEIHSGLGAILNQKIECSLKLSDEVVRTYKTEATGTTLSPKKNVTEEVTVANLKSIAAQMRSDSTLIEAVE